MINYIYIWFCGFGTFASTFQSEPNTPIANLAAEASDATASSETWQDRSGTGEGKAGSYRKKIYKWYNLLDLAEIETL